jgi:RNA polymerase sigma factor (sigma-70 family)
MNTSVAPSPVHDAQLVERSLLGDTAAFGDIVERYQGLICGLAYSACGNAHLSEDLGQETFIAAWRQLRDLREADKLKGWLCGIARNVINGHLRKQQRTPTAHAGELHESLPALADSPSELAMSRQEEALVWRTLEALPENYREPLVLFYRQQESIAAVAASLDLSEDVVKQRLSRGRAMLTEQVGRLVKDSLRKSGPGKAFSLAVVAALPLLATSSCATALGVTAAKGAATAKAVSWGVFAGAVLSPILGIVTTWFGYKVGIDSARSDEERRFVIKLYRVIVLMTLAGGAAILALRHSAKDLFQWHPALFGAAVISFIVIYAAFMIGGMVWAWRRQRSMMQRAALTGGSAPAFPPGKWALPQYERRSQLVILGLPLYHVRIGSRSSGKSKLVKAWFAAGECAIGGIFAFGALAIAPVSFGGAAVGILPFGGLSLGVLALGGFAIGVWSAGGLVVGVWAFGAVAAGWQAAYGAMAVAHDYAIGESAAVALHANDSMARAMMDRNPFFQHALAMESYAVWVNLLFLAPFVWRLWSVRRAARDRGEIGPR